MLKTIVFPPAKFCTRAFFSVNGFFKFFENIKNLLFSSTAAVYKDGMYRVTEKSIVKPKSVYGKTKLRAENLIKTKCKKLGINYGILRYFNIVGASPSGKYGLINISDHLFKNFSKQVNKLLKKEGFHDIIVRKDFRGKYRMVKATKK